VVVALALPLTLLLPALPLYVDAWRLGPAIVPPISNALWLGALLAGTLGAGISGVTPFLLAQLFPARVRALSIGIVYHVGALLAAATPLLIAWLARSRITTLASATALVVAAAAFLTLAILFLRPAGALPASVLGGSARFTSSRWPSRS
jgi:SHS family lactate transporter-like MFS transporter